MLDIFLGIGLCLSLAYIFIIILYLFYWKRLPSWQLPTGFKSSTSVTVIIPARNEAENIQNCIQSILDQNYPSQLLEIIVIDDFSIDQTAHIVQSMNHPSVKLIQLKDELNENEVHSFKKKAIEIAISKSDGALILTTDADCIVPLNWLDLMVSFYQDKNYKFIAAPVVFYDENLIIERFQSLDFMGMMGVSGAGVEGRFMNMCNGANLGYEKQAFYEVGGFKGIDQLASGDDMLLMQKMAKKYPQGVGYLKNKDVAVKTKAKSTIQSFFDQRIRWASKSGAYPEKKITIILGIVFLYSWYLVLGIPVVIYFFPKGLWVFVCYYLIKIILDYLFLREMSNFFRKGNLLRYFIPSFFIHLLYIISIGTLSQFINEYNWKGRKTI